jgi:hypothetical protein
MYFPRAFSSHPPLDRGDGYGLGVLVAEWEEATGIECRLGWPMAMNVNILPSARRLDFNLVQSLNSCFKIVLIKWHELRTVVWC